MKRGSSTQISLTLTMLSYIERIDCWIQTIIIIIYSINFYFKSQKYYFSD